MIVLYREEKSPAADAIEAEFREMTLGYDCVILDSVGRAQELFGAGHTLPAIKNNERVVSGEAIRAYLKELENFMRDWLMFQSSCCYVDEDGDRC
jgi:hypothetical protein